MAFDITILGSAGTHTGPGRACSSYLLRADGYRLLVDCGNGSTANLQQLVPFSQMDAVLITHRHADHCVDLIGMFYAMKFHAGGTKRIPFYAAPEVSETLAMFLSTDSQMQFADAFPHTEIHAGERYEFGPMTVDLFHSIHPAPTVSLRVACEDRIFAYSSDSAGGPDLVECARDADMFLCEATWQGPVDDWPEGIHLTAATAGAIGTQAGVKRLVLTHVLPSVDRMRHLEEAATEFDGDLALADDLQVWTLT